jgi:DNA repair photolyase
MNLEFQDHTVRKIVNVHKHVDGGWFWDKYSAHPYIGCRSGCEFCYSRGGHYLGKRDPETFDKFIQVKTNAPDLLRRELARLAPDVISCGDWQQPAEDRYGLSRRMLEVVLEVGFPLLVIERSPLLSRDTDLLVEIMKRTWACVALSFSNVDPALKAAFEPCSPGLDARLQTMERMAQAGIPVGMSLMPILPGLGDDAAHLEAAVRAAKDHGASFVLGAGLSMMGIQADRTLATAKKIDPSFETSWRKLYGWAEGGRPNYGPAPEYSARLGLAVRELCTRYGLPDRMPRYTGAGPLAVNKRIAERLFLKTYDLELEQEPQPRIWAYRKAAWTVDEWPASLAEMYRDQGDAGLRTLPGIGAGIAAEIERYLRELQPANTGHSRSG